jgi:hypothetical protein
MEVYWTLKLQCGHSNYKFNIHTKVVKTHWTSKFKTTLGTNVAKLIWTATYKKKLDKVANTIWTRTLQRHIRYEGRKQTLDRQIQNMNWTLMLHTQVGHESFKDIGYIRVTNTIWTSKSDARLENKVANNLDIRNVTTMWTINLENLLQQISSTKVCNKVTHTN